MKETNSWCLLTQSVLSHPGQWNARLIWQLFFKFSPLKCSLCSKYFKSLYNIFFDHCITYITISVSKWISPFLFPFLPPPSFVTICYWILCLFKSISLQFLNVPLWPLYDQISNVSCVLERMVCSLIIGFYVVQFNQAC